MSSTSAVGATVFVVTEIVDFVVAFVVVVFVVAFVVVVFVAGFVVLKDICCLVQQFKLQNGILK